MPVASHVDTMNAMSGSLDAIEFHRALAAKLSLPHQGFVLSRPRLLEAIEPARTGGVITVTAGPGCGKTSFIVDLLSSSTVRTIYFAVDKEDRDPIHFMRCLMAALGMKPPQRQPEQVLGWQEQSSWPFTLDLVKQTSDFLASQEEPTLIAIDDVHLIDESADVVRALSLLIKALPPGWTVLLASRTNAPFELDIVKLGGRVANLQCQDLKLTPEEVGDWAEKNWRVELDSDEERKLWSATDGWPAALVLLQHHLLSHGAEVRHLDVMKTVSRGNDLRQYLERNVFSDMQPQVAQVILAAGLLPQVTFPRDDTFLDEQPGFAQKVLEEFVSRGLLVNRVGENCFILHPLLRGFSECEADDEGLGRARVERAAEHLLLNGEARQAARLFLKVGNLGRAAVPMRELALSSLYAISGSADEDWQELLPIEMSDEYPWLWVARGRVLQQRAEYRPAQQCYERAARALSAAADKQGLLAVLLRLSFCHYAMGTWDQGLAVMSRCHTLVRSTPERVEVLMCEASLLIGLCRWDDAAENWEKALALASGNNSESLALRASMCRGRLFYSLGHYRLGRLWALRAVDVASRSETPARLLFLNSMAYHELITGNVAEARTLCEQCLQTATAEGLQFVEISALSTMAAARLASWDYRGGIQTIRKAYSKAEKAADAEEMFATLMMLGDVRRRILSPGKAIGCHETCLDLVKDRLSDLEKAQALTGMAMDLIAMGELEQGEATLEQGMAISRRLGLLGSLAPALLYKGWLHALAGRESDATRALTEAMKIADEHDHVYFFCQEAQVAMPIYALCERYGAGRFVRERIVPRLPDKLQKYFRELTEGRVYPTDVPLGSPNTKRRMSANVRNAAVNEKSDPGMIEAMATLTDREHEVLQMISVGMPNKVIGAKLFITEKTVKTHANHVFRKLGVTSRLQATLAFQSCGWARPAGRAGTKRGRKPGRNK